MERPKTLSARDRISIFVRGAASTIDLSGFFYSPRPRKTDAQAIKSDWQAVGDDLKKSMKKSSSF